MSNYNDTILIIKFYNIKSNELTHKENNWSNQRTADE